MSVVKVGRKYFSYEFTKQHFPSALNKSDIVEESSMTNKITVAVSLPQGVTEPNFGAILGTFRRKKFKDSGKEITSKSGKEIYSMPLDITKLKAMMNKYPNIVAKDKNTKNDIVWITGFLGNAEKTETKSSW